MQSKLLHQSDGKRTFAVILQKGDEAMRCLQDFAVKEGLGAWRGDVCCPPSATSGRSHADGCGPDCECCRTS